MFDNPQIDPAPPNFIVLAINLSSPTVVIILLDFKYSFV